MDDFAVFIISHERAENLATYETLRRQGYSGNIYIIVDDEDEQLDVYKSKFGDKLFIFSKEEMMNGEDAMDNFRIKTSALHARNYAIKKADEMGLKAFALADDDIQKFSHRYVTENKFKAKKVVDPDKVLELCISILDSESLVCVAFANNAGFFGGIKGKFSKGFGRIVSQFMILKCNADVQFVGTRQEDFNICAKYGKVGKVFMEIYDVDAMSPARGTNKGGLNLDYINSGQYTVIFYSFMLVPSCLRIIYTKKGKFEMRTQQNNFVPQIVDERWKKQ